MHSGVGTGERSCHRNVLAGPHSLAIRSNRKENFPTCLNISHELVILKISSAYSVFFQKFPLACFYLLFIGPQRSCQRWGWWGKAAGKCFIIEAFVFDLVQPAALEIHSSREGCGGAGEGLLRQRDLCWGPFKYCPPSLNLP